MFKKHYVVCYNAKKGNPMEKDKNKITYLPFGYVFQELVKIAKEQDFKNIEAIKWIIVKVLRLKRDQYDSIISVGEYHFENMKIALNRHIKGETLGKIFGFIEFYGNFFNVTENVFDPRLSTEALVDAVLKSDNAKNKKVKIIDLCTGSGCVAITLSQKLKIKVDAVDISPLAIEIARLNNEKIKANANFFEMDLNNNWDSSFKEKYDIIVSNPPYWNAEKILANAEKLKNNPKEGFLGGDDGLHFIRLIIKQAPKFLNEGGELFLEIEPDQEKNIRKLLNKDFKDIKTFVDYRNITRVISAKIKQENYEKACS